MKRKIFYLVIGLGVFIVAILVLLLTIGGAPLFSNLTGYKSVQTLNGAVVMSTDHMRIEDVYLDTWQFQYDQIFSSGLIMHQRKRSWRSQDMSCESKANRRDQHVLKKCIRGTIDKGGEYTVAVTSDQGKLSGVDIVAYIGETEMYIGVPKNHLESFAEYEQWQEFFDSMEPISLKFRPYGLYVTQSGPG